MKTISAGLATHLAGEVTREQAIVGAQTETRQYAKRQLTWARRNMIAWKWITHISILGLSDTRSLSHLRFGHNR